MSEIVIFADAEALLVRYLADALSDRGRAVPVSTKKLTGQSKTIVTSTFVVVALLGGSQTSARIEAVNFSIEAHAPDEVEAAELAALIRGLIPGIAYAPGSSVLGTTERARPQPFPDPMTGLPSYTQQHEIRISGTAA